MSAEFKPGVSRQARDGIGALLVGELVAASEDRRVFLVGPLLRLPSGAPAMRAAASRRAASCGTTPTPHRKEDSSR